MVTLAKDTNRSNKKPQNSKIQNNSNSKTMHQSNKNLKIDISETNLRDLPLNYLSNTSMIKSNSNFEDNMGLSRSTKNLYGPPSKSRLLEEIDDVN